MLMLIGDSRSKKMVESLRRLGWGRIWIDRKPTPYDGEPWGFDNGAYRDWRNNLPFNETAYLHRFDAAYKVGVPYLAVTPDIVAGGMRSLEFSQEWRRRLPDNWPWFLAVQDGMQDRTVSEALASGNFSGIFLGGTNGFKRTASIWRDVATKAGCLFHYGRAGTPRKIAHARRVGADSCDSTAPTWTMEKWDWFVECFKYGHPQMDMKWDTKKDIQDFIGGLR